MIFIHQYYNKSAEIHMLQSFSHLKQSKYSKTNRNHIKFGKIQILIAKILK